MTKIEHLFVKAYAATGNARESAKLAGFTGTSTALSTRGHRLLRREDIREAISQKISKLKGKIQ